MPALELDRFNQPDHPLVIALQQRVEGDRERRRRLLLPDTSQDSRADARVQRTLRKTAHRLGISTELYALYHSVGVELGPSATEVGVAELQDAQGTADGSDEDAAGPDAAGAALAGDVATEHAQQLARSAQSVALDTQALVNQLQATLAAFTDDWRHAVTGGAAASGPGSAATIGSVLDGHADGAALHTVAMITSPAHRGKAASVRQAPQPDDGLAAAAAAGTLALAQQHLDGGGRAGGAALALAAVARGTADRVQQTHTLAVRKLLEQEGVPWAAVERLGHLLSSHAAGFASLQAVVAAHAQHPHETLANVWKLFAALLDECTLRPAHHGLQPQPEPEQPNNAHPGAAAPAPPPAVAPAASRAPSVRAPDALARQASAAAGYTLRLSQVERDHRAFSYMQAQKVAQYVDWLSYEEGRLQRQHALLRGLAEAIENAARQASTRREVGMTAWSQYQLIGAATSQNVKKVRAELAHWRASFQTTAEAVVAATATDDAITAEVARIQKDWAQLSAEYAALHAATEEVAARFNALGVVFDECVQEVKGYRKYIAAFDATMAALQASNNAAPAKVQVAMARNAPLYVKLLQAEQLKQAAQARLAASVRAGQNARDVEAALSDRVAALRPLASSVQDEIQSTTDALASTNNAMAADSLRLEQTLATTETLSQDLSALKTAQVCGPLFVHLQSCVCVCVSL